MSDAGGGGGHAARQSAMAVMAHADEAEFLRLARSSGLLESARMVRGPETGLVTIRGRIGGGGAAFNVGEATVTRASARLDSGEIGHAFILGRCAEKARAAAILDAVWQKAATRTRVEQEIIFPLREALATRDRNLGEEIAATKVDFFTMVRGED